MDLGATDELERNLVKQKKSEDGRIQYGTWTLQYIGIYWNGKLVPQHPSTPMVTSLNRLWPRDVDPC
jgi:hypothetical protein